MRKFIVGMFLGVLLLVVASLPASAQVDLKVTLPFAFQAGDVEFPSGAYTISQPNPNAKMSIRGPRGKTGVIATTSLPSENVFAKDKTWLVFHRIGDKYFLSEVWSRHLGFQLPPSAAEKEAKASGKELREVTVNVKM
jgi:hypothetical protein